MSARHFVGALACLLMLTGCDPNLTSAGPTATTSSPSPATASACQPARAVETSPSIAAPLADVPTDKNLITDPSLEETSVGEKFPPGWGNGNLIPRAEYRMSVAEGGRTGNRGWMIEGDGQYAVVPTNRPRVDRALRYAGRGWAGNVSKWEFKRE